MFGLNYHTKALANLFVSGALAISVVPSPAKSPVAAEAVSIDAETNVNDFTREATLAERAAEPSGRYPDTLLTIPVIYIYSPSGDLIYHETGDDRVGHESANNKNNVALQGLPVSAEHLTPIENMPKLKAMLDFIPAYKDKEKSILGDGHYVVYAVTPKVDRVTTTQKAVLALRDRAKGLPVDILMLRIQY